MPGACGEMETAGPAGVGALATFRLDMQQMEVLLEVKTRGWGIAVCPRMEMRDEE